MEATKTPSSGAFLTRKREKEKRKRGGGGGGADDGTRTHDLLHGKQTL
jgi:hypothetical protein